MYSEPLRAGKVRSAQWNCVGINLCCSHWWAYSIFLAWMSNVILTINTQTWYFVGSELSKTMRPCWIAVTRATFGILVRILISPQMYAEMTARCQLWDPETSLKIFLFFLLYSDAFRIQRPTPSHAHFLVCRYVRFELYIYRCGVINL